jgi:tripartite ATP-independent transporter DctP family solute receptor
MRQNRPIQKELEEIMMERGYKVLGWGELGFRNITTKDRPIRKAEDLKGLDIRVPNVPSWLAAFKAWGANPTPMDFAELYSALQQGVVKAQENPPEIIYNSKFYEVQKYLNLTGHANIPCEFTLSAKFWEKLPNDLQEAIMKAATISRDVHVEHVRAANDKLVDVLEEQGMIIVRDIDKASFTSGAEVSYKENEAKIGKDLIEKVRNAR